MEADQQATQWLCLQHCKATQRPESPTPSQILCDRNELLFYLGSQFAYLIVNLHTAVVTIIPYI